MEFLWFSHGLHSNIYQSCFVRIEVSSPNNSAIQLCPPRRWSGARVGVGRLRGAGIPLLGNTKFTKCSFHVFDIDEMHIQDVEDVLRGSSSFPVKVLECSAFQNFKIKIFKTSKCPTFIKNKNAFSDFRNVNWKTCHHFTISKLQMSDFKFPMSNISFFKFQNYKAPTIKKRKVRYTYLPTFSELQILRNEK